MTLLLDALLNFSRSYLPESRGALMDKPLVLTTRLDLTEVDKEAHNLDVASRYPLALYRAAERSRPAKEVEGARRDPWAARPPRRTAAGALVHPRYHATSPAGRSARPTGRPAR